MTTEGAGLSAVSFLGVSGITFLGSAFGAVAFVTGLTSFVGSALGFLTGFVTAAVSEGCFSWG